MRELARRRPRIGDAPARERTPEARVNPLETAGFVFWRLLSIPWPTLGAFEDGEHVLHRDDDDRGLRGQIP
jgi:hypothetical protein